MEQCREWGITLADSSRHSLINRKQIHPPRPSSGRGSFNSSNGKLFILICVAADDTKRETDRQREKQREKTEKTKDKRLPQCLAVPTVAQWGGQHRKRANKLYISNFMNSCWNGKRNENRGG